VEFKFLQFQFLFIQAGDALIQLYNHFISDFETKINLCKFAHFIVVVSRQYLDKDAGINDLEGVISKLRDTGESRVEEPILYVKMQIATFLLEKGSQKDWAKLFWTAWLMLNDVYCHFVKII
jgi:26S proteasome regulatory subunit N9